MEDLPFKGDTVVGNDVWIGQNVTIMPGVHIGDGAIVAANSVVAKNIPPYTIVGGNPCRVLRERFSPELTEALRSILWWDWPVEKITEHLDILCSPNLEDILQFL